MALQHFVVFCQTSTWINHRYTYIPSLLNLLPISLPIPPLLVDTEPLFEFPESYGKFLLAIYFTYGNVSFHGTLSIHLTLSSPLPVSISLFFMSVSSFSSVQFSSVAQSCPTLCDPMNRSTPGLPVHHQLPEFTQTHVHQFSNAIQPSHPLSSLSPPATPPIPPSIRVFSNESTLHMRWPKYWSFSFSSSPSNDHPVLISFRIYWLDLLAVQGNVKSLLQHHSSKASIFQHSAFLTVQLSYPYMFFPHKSHLHKTLPLFVLYFCLVHVPISTYFH